MLIHTNRRWWPVSAVSPESEFSLRVEGACSLRVSSARGLQMRGFGLTHDQQRLAATTIPAVGQSHSREALQQGKLADRQAKESN